MDLIFGSMALSTHNIYLQATKYSICVNCPTLFIWHFLHILFLCFLGVKQESRDSNVHPPSRYKKLTICYWTMKSNMKSEQLTKDEDELETKYGQLINVKLLSNQETDMFLYESVINCKNIEYKRRISCSNSCKHKFSVSNGTSISSLHLWADNKINCEVSLLWTCWSCNWFLISDFLIYCNCTDSTIIAGTLVSQLFLLRAIN